MEGKELEKTVSLALERNQLADICPSCGLSTFVYEEGCSKCYACGYSEC